MKAIALIVVHGGVAYAYSPEHVDVQIVDLDNLSRAEPWIDKRVRLPKDIGFEQLVEEADIADSVEFE